MDACIGIGMSATDDRQPMCKPYPFTQICAPLLNSVGSADYPALPRQAKALDALLDGMRPGSVQFRIEGAGHYFDDQNDALVEVMIDWLEKT